MTLTWRNSHLLKVKLSQPTPTWRETPTPRTLFVPTPTEERFGSVSEGDVIDLKWSPYNVLFYTLSLVDIFGDILGSLYVETKILIAF